MPKRKESAAERDERIVAEARTATGRRLHYYPVWCEYPQNCSTFAGGFKDLDTAKRVHRAAARVLNRIVRRGKKEHP